MNPEQLLRQLAAAYPKTHIADATLAVYASDLADIDPCVLAEALVTLRRTLRFFPTIAEIRETCAVDVLAPPDTSEAFRQALSGTPTHPLAARARDRVGDGWHWRTGRTNDLERQFRKTYDEIRAQELRRLQVGDA